MIDVNELKEITKRNGGKTHEDRVKEVVAMLEERVRVAAGCGRNYIEGSAYTLSGYGYDVVYEAIKEFVSGSGCKVVYGSKHMFTIKW